MAWKILSFLCLSFCFCVEVVSCAKILAIYPYDLPSHFNAFRPLLEELIRRGHNLTLLSRISLSDEGVKNHTHINVERCTNISSKISDISILKKNVFQGRVNFNKFHIDIVENIIKCPVVQEMIHSKNNHYDLIICELFFGSDFFFALGKKFDAPIISTFSHRLLSFHNWILGNPDPSYFPSSFKGVTENMSLVSRAFNLGYQLFSILLYEFYSLPRYQTMIEKYLNFEQGNVPNIKEIIRNVSVSLVNSHYSLGYIKPELPNIVDVAGIHFTRPKPLPVHLQKFMDEAEHGVIYVSFGSTLDNDMIYQLGLVLVDILKILPQKIIIKWNEKLSSHGSKNILIEDWLPQSDILSENIMSFNSKVQFIFGLQLTEFTDHPNCRLFINHGGYLSLLESLNASVPVIGIPFFGDQHLNLGMVESFGIGMKAEIDKVPAELPGKIDEVLKNPKYKNNMKKRSLLFQNRLASPLDTAIYWVDHVLKHKDTSHLKPASVRLTWYEFYSLDVLVILLVIAGTIFYIMKFILIRFISLLMVLLAKTGIRYSSKSAQKNTKDGLKTD